MRGRFALPIGVVVSTAVVLFSAGEAADLPVLFVPELCTDGSSWSAMFQQLPRRRFGEDLVQLSVDTEGVVAARGRRASDPGSFAINFHDPASNSFDPRAVGNVSIRQKAGQLKRAVDYVARSTGKAQVILVSHGMGGLVARAYVQQIGLDHDGEGIGYDSDVAELITIGTPHLGSDFARIPADWEAGCGAADTVSRREMTRGASAQLLETLNSLAWPSTVRLDAIAAYYSDPASEDSDGLVTRTSQDVRTISSYWATLPNVRVWQQPVERALPGSGQLAPHSAVIRMTTTAALVDGIIRGVDGGTIRAVTGDATVSRPMETEGLPESAHPYANNADVSFSYTLPGNPSAIDVTFDPRTFVQDGRDFLHILTGSNTAIAGSPFTRFGLAGRTIRIQGDTIRIRLTSDSVSRWWGFKLINVTAALGPAPTSILLPESLHPFPEDYLAGWHYSEPSNPAALDVTFDARTAFGPVTGLWIRDGNGNTLDGPFTGTQLAGKTIRVNGGNFLMTFQAESIEPAVYGFKVTKITNPALPNLTPSAVGDDVGKLLASMTMTAMRDVMSQVCLADADASVRAQCAGLPQSNVHRGPVFQPSAVVRLSLYPCPQGGSMVLSGVPANVPSAANAGQGLNIRTTTWRQWYSTCSFTSQGQRLSLNGELTMNGTYWATETARRPELQLSGSPSLSPIGTFELAGRVGGDESFDGSVSGQQVQTGFFVTNPAPTPTPTPAPTPTPEPTPTPTPAPGGFTVSPDKLDFGTMVFNTACRQGPSQGTGIVTLTAPAGSTWSVAIPGKTNPADFGEYSFTLSPASGTGSATITVTLNIRQVSLTTGCHPPPSNNNTFLLFTGSGGWVGLVNVLLKLDQ